MTSPPWLHGVAAILLVALGVAHSVLGERYILRRLFRRQNLPPLFGGSEFTERTLRFAWHLTTLAWWGFAAILLLLSRGAATPLNVARAVAVTALLSAVVTALASRGRHLAWIVFLLVGVAILAAATTGI